MKSSRREKQHPENTQTEPRKRRTRFSPRRLTSFAALRLVNVFILRQFYDTSLPEQNFREEGIDISSSIAAAKGMKISRRKKHHPKNTHTERVKGEPVSPRDD
jgi:hypothetical protein